MKKDSKKYSINHFYFILGNVSGYFEEINGNKYLTLVLTNRNKKKRKQKSLKYYGLKLETSLG